MAMRLLKLYLQEKFFFNKGVSSSPHQLLVMQSFERKECDIEWDSEEETPAKHEYSWEQDKADIQQNTRTVFLALTGSELSLVILMLKTYVPIVYTVFTVHPSPPPIKNIVNLCFFVGGGG